MLHADTKIVNPDMYFKTSCYQRFNVPCTHLFKLPAAILSMNIHVYYYIPYFYLKNSGGGGGLGFVQLYISTIIHIFSNRVVHIMFF